MYPPIFSPVCSPSPLPQQFLSRKPHANSFSLILNYTVWHNSELPPSSHHHLICMLTWNKNKPHPFYSFWKECITVSPKNLQRGLIFAYTCGSIYFTSCSNVFSFSFLPETSKVLIKAASPCSYLKECANGHCETYFWVTNYTWDCAKHMLLPEGVFNLLIQISSWRELMWHTLVRILNWQK